MQRRGILCGIGMTFVFAAVFSLCNLYPGVGLSQEVDDFSWTERYDVERIGPAPESRSFFFIREPILGEAVPKFDLGGFLIWSPRMLYMASPDIAAAWKQTIVSHRFEVDPFFVWTPVNDKNNRFSLSFMLPFVLHTGVNLNDDPARGIIVQGNAGERWGSALFALGDMQVGLTYSRRLADGWTLGAGADFRLPTGYAWERSFATEMGRVVPRLSFAWEGAPKAKRILAVLELGALIHFDRLDRDSFLTPESGGLQFETFFQAGASFDIAKDWFLSLEFVFSFNPEAVGAFGTDGSQQATLGLSIGRRVTEGPAKGLLAQFGGRWDPMGDIADDRRQLGPTQAGLMARISGWPPGKEPAPVNFDVSTLPMPEAPPTKGCVKGDFSVITRGQAAVVAYPGLGIDLKAPRDKRFDSATVMFGNSDITVSCGETVEDVNSDGRMQRSCVVPAGAQPGPVTIDLKIDDESISSPEDIVVCPKINVAGLTRDSNSMSRISGFTGTFTQAPGIGYVLEGGTSPLFASEGDTALRLEESIPVKSGKDFRIRPVLVDDKGNIVDEPSWIDSCGAVEIRVSRDTDACCAEIAARSGMARVPAGSGGRGGSCALRRSVQFDVGSAVMKLGQSTWGALKVIEDMLGDDQDWVKTSLAFSGTASGIRTYSRQPVHVEGVADPFEKELNPTLSSRRLESIVMSVCGDVRCDDGSGNVVTVPVCDGNACSLCAGAICRNYSGWPISGATAEGVHPKWNDEESGRKCPPPVPYVPSPECIEFLMKYQLGIVTVDIDWTPNEGEEQK